jgi:HSP20 family protein
MNQSLKTRNPSSVSRSPFGRSLFPRSIFDEFLNQALAESDNQLSEVLNAAMDVAETDLAFEVKLDLPGVKADEVDIQIDNNTLTVRGQRSEAIEEKNEEKQYHRVERTSGSFARSVVLPTSINEEKTVAEFKDGVLTITAPKTEDAKPRKISIKQ